MNDIDINILRNTKDGTYLLDIPNDNLKQSFSCYRLKIVDNKITSIERVNSVVPIVEEDKVNYISVDKDSLEYKMVCTCLANTLNIMKKNKYKNKKN
jgi:hypothetical protein